MRMASDSFTFVIASLCNPIPLKSASLHLHRTSGQSSNNYGLLSDSCKSRNSWLPTHCSKPSPSDTQDDVDEPIPDARKSSVRKAFEKAAAYKNRRTNASESEKGTYSIAKAKPIPDTLSPNARTPASPEVGQVDASSSPGSDVTRNTLATPTGASPKDYSSRRAVSQDDSTALSGIWKEESRKDEQESEMVSAISPEGLDAGKQKSQVDSSNSLEIEVFTRDGVIRRKVQRPDQTFSKSKELKRSGFSSVDFLGLDFSEKKPAGRPAAGLAAGLEAPPPGTLPEVEIITRDGVKHDELNKGALYKPKVATWGIFQRPQNISQAYGGGRIIVPGEQLETEEEKKTREVRTKQLLDAYHKKIGLDVDPKIKADCMKALKQGNDLLEKGELQSALPFFEKVMQQMPYQSELHGSAALQWSVCLDSMNRFQEARSMYEKISSHPNVGVRKRAKEFLFGFQAMDTLKMSVSSTWDATTYREYFDAFAADGYNSLYKASAEEKDVERMHKQIFLYLGVLMFPILLVFVLVILKST